jgi:hypothetical protein
VHRRNREEVGPGDTFPTGSIGNRSIRVFDKVEWIHYVANINTSCLENLGGDVPNSCVSVRRREIIRKRSIRIVLDVNGADVNESKESLR